MNINQKNIGMRVKSLRKAMGLTQAELAENCNLGEDTIGDIERGVKSFTLQNISIIADCFNVSYDYIVKGESDEDRIIRLPENLSKDKICEIKAVIAVMLCASTGRSD